MTVCGSCGSHEDEGSAFCGACGAFLEFVGQPRERATSPAVLASTPAPASRPAPLPAPPPRLEAVLPGREAEGRRARRGGEPVARGDLACPACGTGNPAERAFCKRCGCPLVQPAAPAPRSWWRRLLDALRGRWRGRRRRDAGERPRRWQVAGGGRSARRGLARISLPMHLITPVLLVLALLGVSVPSLRGEIREQVSGAVTAVRRVVAPQHVPLRPVRVSASSSVPGHPAEHAADGVTTTHWAEGTDGDGAGQVLVLEYDRPVDVRRLGVRLGATGTPDAFAHDPRPERLRLVSGDDSVEVLLQDTVELQDLDARLDGVRRLEVHLLSTFGGRGGTAASIAELTAFRVS